MASDAIKISKESGWKRSWERRHPLTVDIFSGVGATGGGREGGMGSDVRPLRYSV